MNYRSIIEKWRKALSSLPKSNFEFELEIGPVASEGQIRSVESAIGGKLPESLSKFSSQASSRVFFKWEAREPFECDDEDGAKLRIDSGSFLFDLSIIPEITEAVQGGGRSLLRKGWFHYNLWPRSLPFSSCEDGDYFVCVLSGESKGRIAYLSLDQSMGGDFIFDGGFDEFLSDFGDILFVGPSVSYWHCLFDRGAGRLDRSGETFSALSDWFAGK